MPDSKVDFHEAFAALQASFEPVARTSTNPHFKSKYADLTSIMEMLEPKLKQFGFYVNDINERVIVVPPATHCWQLRTLLTQVSTGQQMATSLPLMGDTLQKLGSDITYARRYNRCDLLGIVT